MADRPLQPGSPEVRQKRSAMVALATMGLGTLALCTMLPNEECRQEHPDLRDQWNASGRSGTTHSSSRSTGSSSKGLGLTQTASRGGFGSTGRSVFSGSGS